MQSPGHHPNLLAQNPPFNKTPWWLVWRTGIEKRRMGVRAGQFSPWTSCRAGAGGVDLGAQASGIQLLAPPAVVSRDRVCGSLCIPVDKTATSKLY